QIKSNQTVISKFGTASARSKLKIYFNIVTIDSSIY
ncbi:MAG: hypothetical protein ACI9U5_000205, partial [Colwellia sp.]